MGLSFLNKKIWHPGSFANMERTWLAEQKYREIEIKAMEKAKKIKEEKVIEEMKKIQVSKGLIPPSHLNRLDFMYQCPEPESTKNGTANEDFLLGRKFDDETNNTLMRNRLQKKIVPMFADNYANQKNEDFVKIHEDPLFLILKEQQKQRKEIEQNPYKMKNIINDIKNQKKNSIQLNENEEKKRSQSLRGGSSESDTEKLDDKDSHDRRYHDKKKVKDNYYKYRDKHYDKYEKDKYRYKEESRNNHSHRHSHRHRSKDRERFHHGHREHHK